MARPIRIELPGALYHVTSRGRRDRPIYLDDRDRTAFLDTLGEVARRFDWRCYAYCQMGNHYHLVFRTMDANLCAGMRQLNGVYTQAFNGRHGRQGRLFQDRYRTHLVDPSRYFLPLCRHIVLNPVRAGLVDMPGAWRWSSYRATAGIEPPPDWLSSAALLERVSTDPGEARQCYRAYVDESGDDRNIWQHVRGQIYLGDEAFEEQVRTACSRRARRDGSRPRRGAPPLEAIADSAGSRNAAMAAAYRTGAYSYTDLARYFGLHPGSIGRIISRELDGAK